jgi:hypothetical protein
VPRRSIRLAVALLVSFVATAAAVSGSAAAPTTTGTELVIPLRATITKTGGLHLGATPKVDLETTILFLVTNRSSKPRWFEIGTRSTLLRRTPPVKPGATNRFYYVFRVRGTVPFRWGGSGAAPRSGVFRVV